MERNYLVEHSGLRKGVLISKIRHLSRAFSFMSILIRSNQ